MSVGASLPNRRASASATSLTTSTSLAMSVLEVARYRTYGPSVAQPMSRQMSARLRDCSSAKTGSRYGAPETWIRSRGTSWITAASSAMGSFHTTSVSGRTCSVPLLVRLLFAQLLT